MLWRSARVRGSLPVPSPRPLLLGSRAASRGSTEATRFGRGRPHGCWVNALGPRVKSVPVGFRGDPSQRTDGGLRMNFTVAYKGHSGVSAMAGGMALSFAPNLRRDRVSFAGDLKDPLRFREAISALHAVVVSDLKFGPRDRSAYQAYLKRVQAREQAIRGLAFKQAREKLLAEEPEPVPPGL